MERSYTPREMLAALHRRRYPALLAAAAVLVAGALVILAMPPEYVAESVMQIEPHLVPADFFPAPAASFEERMRTLKHGVLARPVLERVLEETDFVPGWREDPDAAVDRLRRAAEVRLEGEVAGGPPSLLFVVEVRGADRERTARAADLIPRLYADLTRQVLATQARNLRATLDQQLQELSTRLAGEERKVTAFTAEHAVELPAANDANLRVAGALQAQIDARLGAVSDAERRRASLQASLPDAHSQAGLAGDNAEDVLRRLEAARAAYGAEHPEVRRLERQDLEARGRSADQLARFRREAIDAQVALLDRDIEAARREVRDLRRRLDTVQARLDAAPAVGEQLRVLSRDLEIVRGKYASTLSRASDARAAEALLAADAPGLFRVVQGAVAPTRPSGANPGSLLLVTLAAALGAALLVTFLAEYFDTSLRGPHDAGAFGVPVLATIPRIGPRRAHVRR